MTQPDMVQKPLITPARRLRHGLGPALLYRVTVEVIIWHGRHITDECFVSSIIFPAGVAQMATVPARRDWRYYGNLYPSVRQKCFLV